MYTALTFQPIVAGWISKNEYITVEKPQPQINSMDE
jgi:hypothetical protein